MSSNKLSCRGVVFQFNKDAILFEFHKDDDEAIGVVKPDSLFSSLPNGRIRTIPASAKTVEEFSKYIQIGDELECVVTKNSDLKKFTYTEEEEEINEAGEVTNVTHEVEIQPEWFAKEAFLVGTSSQKSQVDKDEIGEIEGERGVALNQKSKDQNKKSDDNGEAKDNEDEKKTKEPQKSQVSTEKTEEKIPAEEEEYATCKLILLKRPVSKTKRDMVKVVSGVMQVMSGKYEGKKAQFSNHNLYVWGHQLHKADLLYNIRAGDEFKCQLTEVSNSVTLLVKKGFLGDIKTEPINLSNSTEFAKWLATRNLDKFKFKKWITDSLDRKPFFPLAAERYPAELLGLFKGKIDDNEDAPEKLVGLLKILEGDLFESLVVFESEDFYFFEVHAGPADIRPFLRKGDRVTCQVQTMSSSEKKRYKKIIPDESFNMQYVQYIADIVYIGPQRPRNPNMKAYLSPEFKSFLTNLGWTVEEFEKLKNPPKQDAAEGIQPEKPIEITPENFEPIFKSATPMVCTVKETVLSSSLTARAMTFQTPSDPQLVDLLQTTDELKVAVHLAKVLTQALVAKMQKRILTKNKSPSLFPVSQELNAQAMRITAAENQLIHKPREEEELQKAQLQAQMLAAAGLSQPKKLPSAPSWAPKPAPSPVEKAREMMKKLEEIESKREEEQGAKYQQGSRTKNMTSNKIKNMFESYKATKKYDNSNGGSDVSRKRRLNESNSRSRSAEKERDYHRSRYQPESDDRERAVSDQVDKTSSEVSELDIDPLLLLRKYKMSGKHIMTNEDRIFFAHVSYPKDTLTCFKVTRKNDLDPEFYSLFTIYFFLENHTWDFEDYLKKAFDNKVTAVNRADRENLIAFMSGMRDTVPNLVNISHRELNPHLYGGNMRRSHSPERSNKNYNEFSEYGSSDSKKRRSRFDRMSPALKEREEPPVVESWTSAQRTSSSLSPPRSFPPGVRQKQKVSGDPWGNSVADYDPLNPTESSPPPPAPPPAPRIRTINPPHITPTSAGKWDSKASRLPQPTPISSSQAKKPRQHYPTYPTPLASREPTDMDIDDLELKSVPILAGESPSSRKKTSLLDDNRKQTGSAPKVQGFSSSFSIPEEPASFSNPDDWRMSSKKDKPPGFQSGF